MMKNTIVSIVALIAILFILASQINANNRQIVQPVSKQKWESVYSLNFYLL